MNNRALKNGMQLLHLVQKSCNFGVLKIKRESQPTKDFVFKKITNTFAPLKLRAKVLMNQFRLIIDTSGGKMVDNNYKKCVQAINYFAQKSGGEINRMKLLKLIWLADRLHLLTYGRLTLDVKYVAMQYGPVPSQIKDITHNTSSLYACDYLDASGHFISSEATVDTTMFSKSEISAYNIIWSKFGHYNQFDLKDLSHEYPEWKRYEDILTKKNTSIPMDMEDFYLKPENVEAAKFDDFEFAQAKAKYMKDKAEEGQALIEAMHEAHAEGRRNPRSRVGTTPCH